jgi:two-component system, OmpR family, sensor kinase
MDSTEPDSPEPDSPEPAGTSRAGRRTIGVRARVLATVLILTALGMAGAGVSTVLMQRNALDDRVDSSLKTEVDEFRAVAAAGTDPTTGKRFTSVAQLLRVALQKQAPDRDETFLTLLNGRPQWVPRGERFLKLEEESALVTRMAALPVDAPVRLAEIDTSAGPVRYAAVQVTVPGQSAVGTYLVAHSLSRDDREITDIAQRFALVSVISLAIIAGVGWLVAGRLLHPLRLLSATADRISHADLTERIHVTGTDDVSELALTFNRMLDRLQHAFETQQEFLDDAGHELRTPITIIRGHLELMAAGDEVDVAETRDLVLDELDRMARLVQDLIVLAKSRRPDFVRFEPVDLGLLTDEVLDKARGLGDRRWRVDARADGVVSADPQRLTQALLQLADNAVKHTEVGQEIAVGSEHVGEHAVRLWVRDDGPGVAAADAARIFERFGRVSDGRRVEGSGLGLSIVTAIARAHGGRAELSASTGSGATFALVLPQRQPPELGPLRAARDSEPIERMETT